VRYRNRRGCGTEVDQPRAHVRGGHCGRGPARIDPGTAVRDGRPQAAGAWIICGYNPAQAAEFRVRDDYAGALAGPRDAVGYGTLRGSPGVVSEELDWRQGEAAWRTRIGVGRGRAADGPSRRGPA